MKKTIRLISSLLLVLVLVGGTAITAFAADSNVTFDGNAKNFIFEPGSEYSPTDLFDDHKGVMPGDILTDTVNVKNDAGSGMTVDIYMRSLGAVELTKDGENLATKEESAAFLNEMTLKVTKRGGSDLFNASPDQTAGLTDWTHLGTLQPGGDVDLDLMLEVPLTMPDKFSGAIGAFDWQFKVVEKPIPQDEAEGDGAQTGDSTNIVLVLGIAVAALLIAVILLITRRRRA